MLYQSRPVPLEGQKITTAAAMAVMEKRAIEEGDASGAEYMDKAAAQIFKQTMNFIHEGGFSSDVVLLCAKGNNSGDAYATGKHLIEEGCQVTALQLFNLDECSFLCKQHATEFTKKGGKILYGDEMKNFKLPSKSVVIDGLLGTGFHGKVEGEMAELIERINQSHHAVISIDIPSGVSGDRGIVDGAAIYADLTIYLGLLKVGHLFNQGYEHVGQIAGIDFGISKKYIDDIEAFAYVVNPKVATRNLPHHKRTSNKYTVGQVGLYSGSPNYSGAAILACHAALRTGAGIVRLYHPEGVEKLVTNMAPEVIRTKFDLNAISEESNRIKAFLVGPGLGRSKEVQDNLEKLYKVGNCPFVIDADALFFFENIEREAVLTPHRGELCHLLKCDQTVGDIDLLEMAEKFAKEKRVTIVCKGAPTTIVSFEGPKIVIPYGNRGMASGGMGDALGGIIASLIAQGKSCREGAILGATLHALAGDAAAQIKSEASMTASDLIDALSNLSRA